MTDEIIKIHKDTLKRWAQEEECEDPFEFIEIVDIDSGRWESCHRMVIGTDVRRDMYGDVDGVRGTYWAADFMRGLTENQDSTWFDHTAAGDGFVEMVRVRPALVVTRQWNT